MYSRLYRTMERYRRPEILEAAKLGVSFLPEGLFTLSHSSKKKKKKLCSGELEFQVGHFCKSSLEFRRLVARGNVHSV